MSPTTPAKRSAHIRRLLPLLLLLIVLLPLPALATTLGETGDRRPLIVRLPRTQSLISDP